MMARRHAARARGSTLLEVMVAVSILAVAALGVAATQLMLVRDARTAVVREQAVFVADSLAEAAWHGHMNFSAASGLGALPDGTAVVSTSGAQASVATVAWRAVPFGLAAEPLAASGRACEGTDAGRYRVCVSLAFAR